MRSLHELIEELIRLGDDRDELEFWKSLYPSMSEDEQQALISNLEHELKALEEKQAEHDKA